MFKKLTPVFEMFQAQLFFVFVYVQSSRTFWHHILTWHVSSANPNFDLGFSHFQSNSEAQLHYILEQRNCESTNRATKHMKAILDQYILEKDLPTIENTPDAELPRLLECFYTDLCTKTGEMYKLQSLKCIRAGLNRYFKEERSVDIIADIHFNKTNEMFWGMAKITRKAGLRATNSFPVIPDEDMEHLGNYFYQNFDNIDIVNPKKLQQAVIFSVIYFTCRWGRENLYNMKLNTYCVKLDASNRKYVQQDLDELDKNHQLDSTELANTAKIFATPGNK